MAGLLRTRMKSRTLERIRRNRSKRMKRRETRKRSGGGNDNKRRANSPLCRGEA